MGRESGVNAGRTKQIKGQRDLREETIPLCHGKSGVDSAEACDKMVLKRANSTFCSVDSVFVWWNTLEGDFVGEESNFKVQRTFVV